MVRDERFESVKVTSTGMIKAKRLLGENFCKLVEVCGTYLRRDVEKADVQSEMLLVRQYNIAARHFIERSNELTKYALI